MGITDPVPCQIPRHDGTLHAENLHTDGFVGNGNNASLHHTPLTDAVLTVGIGAEIEKLAFAHHGFAAAGDYTAALGVNAENNKVDFCAQHIAQQLHLADGHTVGTVGSAGGDHHFFERNDDAEAVVIHDSNRLAAVGLLDTTQRCRKDALAGIFLWLVQLANHSFLALRDRHDFIQLSICKTENSCRKFCNCVVFHLIDEVEQNPDAAG